MKNNKKKTNTKEIKKNTKEDILYIVVPAYNESENIEQLVKDWYPVVEKVNSKSRLVVVNDGSKDDTYEKMQELAKDRPQFIPVTKKNGGHGSAVLYGYRYAIKQGADYIFQTDSDGQTDPNEFPEFWDQRNEYDGIFGSRSNRQDGASRKFVEKTLLFILRILFGVKMPDSNAPFRLMRSDLVDKYIKKLPEDYNLPNVMLTTYFKYYNNKIKFIEISFKPRQGGVNSINIKKITKIGIKAVKDFKKIKKDLKEEKKNAKRKNNK